MDDIHQYSDRFNPDTPIRSELYLPIGEHGILLAGALSPEQFDEGDLLLGEFLVSVLATALDQVKRTERLRAREQQLSSQNERLEEFTSVVSHDLRNPLSVAEGRLELAALECESEHLEYVERAHQRMETLIDDLLALAREGEEAIDPTPLALQTVVARCWDNVDTNDAMLQNEVTSTIEANENRIRQLFENLFRNAVEHGGQDVRITVGDLEDGFFVEDDGPGIPSDARDDVFDPGYSTTEQGTGFGLSIVKEIVDAHGWQIRTTEGVAGGARFDITDVEVLE